MKQRTRVTNNVTITVLSLLCAISLVNGGEQCSVHNLSSSYKIANSCKEIYQLNSEETGNRSGYYWILSGNGITQQYCHMQALPECGEDIGWSQIANITGTDNCDGLNENEWRHLTFATQGNEVPECKQITDCPAVVTFPTHNTSYNKICGRVTAYVKKRIHNRKNIICDNSIDGISISVNSKGYIWVYAIMDGNNDDNISKVKGNHYYCDNLNNTDQILWSVERQIKMCNHSSPMMPWFYRELNHTINDDIKLQFHYNKRHFYIKQIELYIL